VIRTSIENHLIRHWYGSHSPPWYLRMLEPLYASAFQRAHQDQATRRKANKTSMPLIVVGNITVGGTGKTPLVIALSQLALDLDLKPGIASTGYGRKSKRTMVVTTDCEADDCGDEPVLMAERSGATVVVAAKRVDAVKKLQTMDVDLIISDDGLQRADLDPDIEICVVDGTRGLGNGHLLPAGPLRESATRLAEVNCVVSNGKWPTKPEHLSVSHMELQATVVRSLDGSSTYDLAEFRESHQGTNLHAVAAIGNPARFFDTLAEHQITVTTHRFADHHRFTKQDFASMSSATGIIMTEKDAVKCRGLGLENAWYVAVDAMLPDQFEHWYSDKILRLTKDRT
jgi:tetraacyldisaccharide 4'-kinase